MLFILPSEAQQNPMIRKHLCGLQLMGWIIFDHQKNPQLQFLRGLFFSITFFLFNITQVIRNVIKAMIDFSLIEIQFISISIW